MTPLTALSHTFDSAIAAAVDSKTKPPGSLGRIERLAVQLARIQATTRPCMNECTLTLFAADHGIAAEGVSAYPQAVTAQMLANFVNGGAAANVFARTHGVSLRVVDAGVAQPLAESGGLLMRRIGPGTRNFAREPAMTQDQFHHAIAAGYQLAAEGSGQAAAFGEMGIANTSSASMLAHKVLQLDLDALIGRGTGLDDSGLAHKKVVLTKAAQRTPAKLSGEQALTEFGGFEIVMMAGAMIGAASTGKAVLVDGFIATAAAVCALDMDSALRSYLVFAHRSAEPGHRRVLEVLDAEPLLDLDMRLGEGTGALLAWPLLRSAAAMICDMASFDTAGVSGPAETS